MGENMLKQVAVRMVEQPPLYSEEPMDSPEAVIRVMSTFLREMDRELFCVVNLQSDLRPINMEIVSMGVLDAALVHPREVMKSAILSNAASIMVFHNHPSGKLVPSTEDIEVTKRLQNAGTIIGIRLTDHIITGRETGQYYSFRESGTLPVFRPQPEIDLAAEEYDEE